MIVASRPTSSNKPLHRNYMATLRRHAQQRFVGPAMLTGELYARIVWFYEQGTARSRTDVDNTACPARPVCGSGPDNEPENCFWCARWSDIMNKLAQYLKEAEIEDLTAELTADGYLILPLSEQDKYFDLLARKGNQTVAYTVAVRGHSKADPDKIYGSYERAKEQGYKTYTSFVSPPFTREIEFEGIDQLLTIAMQRIPPVQFPDFPGEVVLSPAQSVYLHGIWITADTIRVTGAAYVDAVVHFIGTATRPPDAIDTNLPFHFTLVLKRDDYAILDVQVEFEYSDYLYPSPLYAEPAEPAEPVGV